jgi:uncharacterized protein YkwD
MNAIHVATGLYFALYVGPSVEVRYVSAIPQETQSIAAFEPAHRRQPVADGSSAREQQYEGLVSRVHRQVNEFRRDHGLEPLMLDPMISAEASEHSADMARAGNAISHRGFNQRLQDIRKKIPYRAAAENVAAAAGYEDPARTVVEGWKNSPGHRKNMLGDFSLTGIGIAQSKDGGYFFTEIFLEPIK